MQKQQIRTDYSSNQDRKNFRKQSSFTALRAKPIAKLTILLLFGLLIGILLYQYYLSNNLTVAEKQENKKLQVSEQVDDKPEQVIIELQLPQKNS